MGDPFKTQMLTAKDIELISYLTVFRIVLTHISDDSDAEQAKTGNLSLQLNCLVNGSNHCIWHSIW